MYGSYGSYSSMCSSSAPLDIGSSYLSGSHDASCAFPSWPRRSSLSDSDEDGGSRATSFLSDEDLFPDMADDSSDARSISSAGSAASPPEDLNHPAPRGLTETDLLEMERERAAYQHEVMRFLVTEKERRRQALRRQRRGSAGSSKKSPKNNKHVSMTPIAEAGE